MDPSAAQLNRFEALTAAFAAAADPARAAPMTKYVKDHFEFFGIPSPARRVIQREVLGRWAPEETELVEFADAAWAAPGRELQYAACDAISRRARVAILHQLHVKRVRRRPPVSVLHASRVRHRVLHSEGHRLGAAGVREDGSGRRPRVCA